MTTQTKVRYLFVFLLIITLCLSATLYSTAFAETEEDNCPVQIFVGEASNIVESGTVTNLKFGVVTETACFVYVRFPDGEYESRFVSSNLTFTYKQNGTYTIYAYSLATKPLQLYDLDLTITFDNNPPEICMYQNDNLLPDNSFIKDSFFATISDDLSGIDIALVSISGFEFVPYTGETFTKDGYYEFYVKDIAGNESSASITKDTVAPQIKIYNGNQLLESNACTNATSIKVSAIDNVSGVACVYLKKGNTADFVKYDKATLQLTDSGCYEFYAVDLCGNVSVTSSVTIKNNPPEVSILQEGKKLTNNTYTTGSLISFHINESNATGYVYKASSNTTTTVPNGATFSADDLYFFYAEDDFGNVSNKITITVDRTKPTGSIYVDGAVVENETTVHSDFKYICYDNVSGVSYCQIKKPNSNWDCYNAGTVINADNFNGEYSFRCVDKCGNVSEISTITLVALTPTTTLDGVNINGHANGNVVFSWEGNAYAVLYKDEIMAEYLSGTEIFNEGNYRIVLKNNFDYEKEFCFIIDKSFPSYICSKDIINGYTKNISFSWEDDNVIAIIKRVDETIPYEKDTLIFSDGQYQVAFINLAGNSISVEFIIDTVAPTSELLGVTNGETTKTNVVITNLSKQATVDVYLGNEKLHYVVGETLSDVGKYTVVLTDLAGNQTTYSFEILFSLNFAGIMFIVIVVIAVFAILVVFLINKKVIRVKFKKKKAKEKQSDLTV